MGPRLSGATVFQTWNHTLYATMPTRAAGSTGFRYPALRWTRYAAAPAATASSANGIFSRQAGRASALHQSRTRGPRRPSG